MAPPAAAPFLQTRQGQHHSIECLPRVDKRRVTNLRWGLCRGLLSGLLNTTRGALEVLVGGWPPAETLALFALWASVSPSLQR